MLDTVRMGIIGIGNIGSAHAHNIYGNKVKGMSLNAVCDINPGRLKWAEDKAGIKLYADYSELLKDSEIDAVLIATPHQLHPIIAEAAFSAEKHVLTEKPAGIDITSVKQMNAAAERSGKVFGIMYNQRTNPLYSALRDYVAEGRLGELKRVVWIINNWYRTQAYYDSGSWRATWSGEGGGVLLNQCPHNLDIWQWITGMPKRVRAFCRYGNYHNIDVEDDVTIYAEYENGASGTFITSTGEYPGTNRLEISGTKGKAVIENGVLKLYSLERDEREICACSPEGMPKEKVIEEEVIQDKPESGHVGILQNFADGILNGEKLLAPGVEGINGLTITNAAYLSDWTNNWAEIPLDEGEFIRRLKKKQNEEARSKGKVSEENFSGEYIDRWKVRW